jgi:hypothetical protein
MAQRTVRSIARREHFYRRSVFVPRTRERLILGKQRHCRSGGIDLCDAKTPTVRVSPLAHVVVYV